MKKIAIILTIFSSCALSAQDIHFSQFYATPLFTNPAFAGHFEGTYRFSGVVRQQWLSVSAQPYQTFGGGVDMNGPLSIMPIGIGLQFGHDYAGVSNLTTTQVNGCLSGLINFGSSNYRMRIGGMAGLFQRSLDFSNLTFDDQFNGIRFDPNLVSGEIPAENAIIKINFGLGAYLERWVSKRKFIGVGLSMFNVLEPDIAMFKSTELRLYRRHNAHLFSSIRIGAVWDLMPAAQVMIQGPHQEILVGSSIRYHLNTGLINPQAIRVGFWGRPGDAGNVTVGMDFNNLFLGGSYDVNLSTLQPASNYRGGWEFTVIYIIPTVREQVKRLRQCPDYL